MTSPYGPQQQPGPPPLEPRPAVTKVEERAHPLTPLVRGWVAVVTIAWALLQERLQNRHDGTDRLPWWVFVAVIGGVAALGLVAGFISWRFTKFIADETELRVESGWISRQSRRISYTRLQSVDVMQPLAPRLLGLAEVRIDAGAHDSTKLRYLSRRRAYELRDFLMLRAHGAQVSVDAAKVQTSDPLFIDVGRTDKVVVTVSPHELLLGALVSHDLLSLLLGFAVPIGVAWAVTAYAGGRAAEALPVFALAGGVPLVISIGQYFARRVMAQFNFTLAETQAGLRITRGLTNLTSQTVPVRRIQSIRINQPLFWRPLGRYRVDLEVLGLGEATHNESTSKVSTLLLPIGSKAQVDAALSAVWPGLRLDAIGYVQSPRRAKVLDPLSYSWNAHGLDDDVVVTRRGWLNRLTSIVPHARLQSVAAHQGPLERLLGLANVTFHTTGLLHTHAAIHIDVDRARTLVYAEADRAMTSRDAELLG
ncbi:MAG: PH domain-containing protein [Propionibacteriaceae bacterium]